MFCAQYSLKMEDKKVHFRHILLFFFRKGLKATEAQREICGVYGDSAISADTCQRWFTRFRSGDINLADAARSGRPSTTDDNQILAAISGPASDDVRDRRALQHCSYNSFAAIKTG